GAGDQPLDDTLLRLAVALQKHGREDDGRDQGDERENAKIARNRARARRSQRPFPGRMRLGGICALSPGTPGLPTRPPPASDDIRKTGRLQTGRERVWFPRG